MQMLRRAVLILVLLIPSLAAASGMRLVMVEQPGCIHCRAWDEEIAPIYPRTAEGKRAPLTRVQLRGPLPDDMRFDRPAVFTPTFVLLVDGQETGRIEGYPGADFFWGLLSEMLDAQNTGKGAEIGSGGDR